MRLLIAAQEFKGSLTANEVCQAIAAGVLRSCPDWELDIVPLADGGPGFLDALEAATASERRLAGVHDAIGRPVQAAFLVDRAGRSAIIESAQANGLHLIEDEHRDPLRAETHGVGELVYAALQDGCHRLLIGVGGSATSDGGTGMATALGARLLDGRGRILEVGIRSLLALESIEWPGTLAADIEVTVATDVRSPLVGPNGAAAVFGPQKGLLPNDIPIVENALSRFAEVVERDLGQSIAELPGAGAAGGLAGGLVAFLGAKLVSGFDVVASATDLASRVREADFVVTGEGSFDTQSAAGKGPARLAQMARESHRGVVIFAGQADAAADVIRLTDIEPNVEACIANAAEVLGSAAGLWAASVVREALEGEVDSG